VRLFLDERNMVEPERHGENQRRDGMMSGRALTFIPAATAYHGNSVPAGLKNTLSDVVRMGTAGVKLVRWVSQGDLLSLTTSSLEI
jgi:hypothetical protein